MGTEGDGEVRAQCRKKPSQPKGKKKHHDTIRDMMADDDDDLLSSSHVLSSISRGGTQWVYGYFPPEDPSPVLLRPNLMMMMMSFIRE
jgi:hypothetical protein